MSTDATYRNTAVALAEALGGLPLALEQAAAYVEREGVSLAAYLELFRERAAVYVPPASPSDDYPPALAVTFELAFARIREKSPASANLLTLCAFLAPDEVPLEIFGEGIGAGIVPDAPAAAEKLQAYALSKVRGGSFLRTHRLTQAAARDRLGVYEKRQWAEAAVRLMRDAFPFELEDTRTWPPSARLLQHALAAAGHAGALGVADEPSMLLLNYVGLYLCADAEMVDAKAALDKSVALGEKLFGPSAPELALLLNNIGETLRRQGSLDEAAQYLKRALAIDEAALGPNHPGVAVSLNNIGNLLDEREIYGEARVYYERALSVAEAAYGAAHPQVAAILNNIGMTLHSQDDVKGSRAYYERALLIDEEVYGPDHPNVAIDLNNLGSALGELGHTEAAHQHLERALRISLQHWGEKHPFTLAVRENLDSLSASLAGGSRRKKPRKRRKLNF